MSGWLTQDLIVLDESGAHLGMSSLYGRAPGGRRVKGASPLNKGLRISMISAISVRGVEAALYGNWATDTAIFKEFIEKQLLPKLSENSVVIYDNISFHKNKEVITLIQSTGARVEFLPGYSPDLSPIELMWSKIKHYLRRLAPRTFPKFKTATSRAFHTITQNDLLSWFKHCGYSTNTI